LAHCAVADIQESEGDDRTHEIAVTSRTCTQGGGSHAHHVMQGVHYTSALLRVKTVDVFVVWPLTAASAVAAFC